MQVLNKKTQEFILTRFFNSGGTFCKIWRYFERRGSFLSLGIYKLESVRESG